MLLTKFVQVRVIGLNLKYYNDLGYSSNVGDTILVDINHLQRNSNIIVSAKCDICGNEKDVIFRAYNKYLSKSPDNKYRCVVCKSELRNLTMISKYGSGSNVIKYKKTLEEKYGGHFNKLDLFKDKIKKTSNIRYGVDYPMNNDLIKKKQQNILLDKYGFTTPLKNESVLEKSLNTMINRYGHAYSMQVDSIKNKIITNSKITKKEKIINNSNNIIDIDYVNNIYRVFCDSCRNIFEITPHIFILRSKYKTTICTICNELDSHKSGMEDKLVDFIRSKYNGEIVLNSRKVIPPFEIDIFIPEFNIAFEFNGLYWHSELFKDKLYHFNKSDMCEENGIRLIHVWEDDWVYKSEIVKSMILNRLNIIDNKIWARNCDIRLLNDNKLVRDFLDENHIQGYVGSKIKLGLFHNDELVSLMTFGKNRLIMNNVKDDKRYELIRFCNKKNTVVVGAFSKLLKYFKKNNDFDEIITYADRSYSSGDVYIKNGFNYIGKTSPNYYYIINGKRAYRFNFRKDILVKEGYDSNKTESEIMSDRGIERVFNAGNLKFIYNNI